VVCFCLGLAAVAVSAIDNGRVTRAMTRYHDRVKGTAPEFGPGEHEFTLQRPEGTRSYWVYVPESYDNSTAVPLIFTFHGLGDDCWDFGHDTGLINMSDANNFILVYPCGWPGLLGNAWNAGMCCLLHSGIDDIQFTRDMVAAISENFLIRKDLVFTSGFSNGGFMSETLACQAADLLAGAASVSGITQLVPGNSGGETACDQDYSPFRKTVPMVHIHGNFDFVVPWTGDAILGFPDVPTDFSDWANRNGCTGTPVQTLNSGPYTNQVYQTCTNGTTLDLVKHDGGGHEWPQDQYFSTPNYIYNYFKQYIDKSM